jgi:hypothetical protein
MDKKTKKGKGDGAWTVDYAAATGVLCLTALQDDNLEGALRLLVEKGKMEKGVSGP